MQIIYFVPTYSVPFEIKLKLWNALKPDYRVPAVSVSWLVSQYRLQITTIFDPDWEAILGIEPAQWTSCTEEIIPFVTAEMKTTEIITATQWWLLFKKKKVIDKKAFKKTPIADLHPIFLSKLSYGLNAFPFPAPSHSFSSILYKITALPSCLEALAGLQLSSSMPTRRCSGFQSCLLPC